MDKKKESNSKLSKISEKVSEAAACFKAGKQVYNQVSEIKELNNLNETKDIASYYIRKTVLPGGGFLETLAMDIMKSIIDSISDKIVSLFK